MPRVDYINYGYFYIPQNQQKQGEAMTKNHKRWAAVAALAAVVLVIVGAAVFFRRTDPDSVPKSVYFIIHDDRVDFRLDTRDDPTGGKRNVTYEYRSGVERLPQCDVYNADTDIMLSENVGKLDIGVTWYRPDPFGGTDTILMYEPPSERGEYKVTYSFYIDGVPVYGFYIRLFIV